MQRLSALDAWLLDLETPTASGHIGTLVGVDSSGVDDWGIDEVRAVLEPRLHTVAPLTHRLVSAPFGVGGRYLVEDPHFDLEFHVRELVLPSPGTTQQLADQVAALHARALDRTRPMWELYVVTGRHDGRAAVYAKMHRTLIDEASGTDLMAALLDPDPEPVIVEEEPAQDAPGASVVDLAREEIRALAGDPRELGYAVPDALQRLGRFAGDAGLPGSRWVAGAAGVAGRLLRPAPHGTADRAPPRTRLDAALTPHRRIASGAVSMDDVLRGCAHHGTEVGHLVLAATAAALRRWLLDHDALPVAPLVAAVPALVATEQGSLHPVPLLVELPTHLRGDADRVVAARDAMRTASEGLDLVPDEALEELAAEHPTALAALAARGLAGLASTPRTANLTIAHTLGPTTPLYLAGAPVDEVVPLPALGQGTGGLAVTSYRHGDRLHLGLTACREIVPDLGRVLDYLTDAFAQLRPEN